jgi:hypothetical protein
MFHNRRCESLKFYKRYEFATYEQNTPDDARVQTCIIAVMTCARHKMLFDVTYRVWDESCELAVSL